MTAGLLAGDIAATVRGSLEGDPAFRIDGAAGLAEASKSHIAFFQNRKYVEQLSNTKAGIVLIPTDTSGLKLPAGTNLIRVANPPLAFAQVLSLLQHQQPRHPKPGVHARALVDPAAHVDPSAAVGALTVVESGAQVGPRSIIYSGCYIGASARIGSDCLIHPNVVLREDTELGDRVIIQPGAVVGSDGYGFATEGGKHHKIPQLGNVVVEDDVEIGANVTIDRATTGSTRIGAGTKIDNMAHIGHNVQIGKNCLIVAFVGISGSTRIGNQVTLAGQVGVTGHVTVGDGAVVAAQSGIIGDVEPGAVLYGTPARPHRQAMKIEVLLGKLPEIYETVKELKKKLL